MGGQTDYCRPGCKCINCENVQHPCVPHISPDEDPHSDITELNDEEENDDDDKSDTEDDTVVDSVDTLPNDIFTEYWDVLEEEQDETGFK